MEKQYINLELKKSDGGDLTIVASDETLDRYNEVVPLDAWDLKNFKKNPILLVNHDYKVENVVGRARNLKLDDNALTFTPDFHSITQLARDVSEMVKQGILKTVSVGFLPHMPAKDGDRPSNELLEISFVPIPANPSAMALAMKSIDDEQKKAVEEWVEKQKSTEVQTIILSKEKFETAEDATKWVTDHDFRADKIDETENSFRFRQFNPGEYNDGSERTIEITDGVKAVICKRGKSVCPIDKELIDELVELREGRVLSGKSRTKIENGLTALEQAVTVLRELLEATDPNAEKNTDEPKGRDPRVEQGKKPRKPKPYGKAPSSVVRALQGINRSTNEILRQIK